MVGDPAGADLKIISDNVLTVAEFVWAVKPDSPIKSIKDFKGKKIGYTNPRSTSQALARMLLQAGGLKPKPTPSSSRPAASAKASPRSISGQIDVAPITEPLWSKVKDKYRAVVVASEVLPPLDNVVGVTTVEMAEKKRRLPARRACARRRKAVRVHDRESGRGRRRSSPRNTTSTLEVREERGAQPDPSQTRRGVPYWGEGQIHMEGHEAHDRGAALGRRASRAKSTAARSSTRAFCPTISRAMK